MSNYNQRLNGSNALAYLGVNALQPPEFVTAKKAPASNDSRNFQLGTIWLDLSASPITSSNVWMLVALQRNVATWINFGAMASSGVMTLTGNIGGAVGPDGSGNVNVVGDNTTITFVGNPGTNTLTASVTGSIADSFATDSGTATPALGVLTISGTNGITTSGSGSTVDINLTVPVSIAHGGTNATSMTNTDGVVYYDGTSLVTTTVGTATQVLTSNGAGVAPTFQAITFTKFPWTVVTGTGQLMAVDNGYIANNAATVTLTLPATAAVGDIVQVTGINNATGWRIAQNAGQTIYYGTGNTTTGIGGSLASTSTRDSIELVCVVANTDFNVLASIGNITIV